MYWLRRGDDTPLTWGHTCQPEMDWHLITQESPDFSHGECQDLQQKIEYKANEYGIKVSFIKPNYTSQRCSKCGHIHKDNRKTQAEFVCVKCGYKSNADINAARNIAILGIDEIISEQKVS